MNESDEYGFMATLDDGKLAISDSDGGGHWATVQVRDDAVNEIEKYIKRCARMFAEQIADDLFDEDDDDEPS